MFWNLLVESFPKRRRTSDKTNGNILNRDSIFCLTLPMLNFEIRSSLTKFHFSCNLPPVKLVLTSKNHRFSALKLKCYNEDTTRSLSLSHRLLKSVSFWCRNWWSPPDPSQSPTIDDLSVSAAITPHHQSSLTPCGPNKWCCNVQPAPGDPISVCPNTCVFCLLCQQHKYLAPSPIH